MHAHKFKRLAVQMQGVDVVAGVAEFQTVAAAFLERMGGLHGLRGEGFAIERPAVEAAQRAVLLDDEKIVRLIRRGGASALLAEESVILKIRGRLDPLRLPGLVCIFENDAHAVAAILVGEIAHDPDAGRFISTNAEMRSAVPSQSNGTSACVGTGLLRARRP
jgi:hypothetical protein